MCVSIRTITYAPSAYLRVPIADGFGPAAYTYSQEVEVSVTGGNVYCGVSVPDIHGQYIFADLSGRQTWSLKYEGRTPYEIVVDPILPSQRLQFVHATSERGVVPRTSVEAR